MHCNLFKIGKTSMTKYAKLLRIFWILLFAVTLLILFISQRTVPLMMDDTWYATVLTDETPLQSLADVFKAQVWHYLNWGGRSVAHTILQLLFLCCSTAVADVLNVIITVLLAWLLISLAGVRSLGSLVLCIGALHALNIDWLRSMYWQTGACNYLYTSVFVFGFLLLYFRALENKALPKGILVLAPVLGLLAGWSNENIGPAVWLLTLAVLYLYRKEKGKLPLWMLLGNAACLIGTLFLILAPGNSVRSAAVITRDVSGLWEAFLRCYYVSRGILSYVFLALLLTAIVWIVNCAILGNKPDKKDILLSAGAILSLGAMLLSPHYPERAGFGTMCMLIAVIFSQASQIVKTAKKDACTVAVTGVGLFLWLQGMYQLLEYIASDLGWIL